MRLRGLGRISERESCSKMFYFFPFLYVLETTSNWLRAKNLSNYLWKTEKALKKFSSKFTKPGNLKICQGRKKDNSTQCFYYIEFWI